ncbi:MAG: DUF4145 domain-containing protein [Methanothrix sp.]
MKCPHCFVNFSSAVSSFTPIGDDDGGWRIKYQTCPACNKLIIFLDNVKMSLGYPLISTTLIRPKGISRTPVPSEVPDNIVEDYKEACLVLADSPKASAALGRRCLQNLLRTAAKVKPGNLANEIQQVLDSHALPTYLAESIDSIRNIGNFAAHPMKSQQSGDIIPVEPGEAEWNLDVLEGLFDFYYVQPAIIAKKRADLNAKLAVAGKPSMK